MTALESYSPAALQFLHHLKAHNTKDWVTANKSTYAHHIKDPTKTFANDMAHALGDLTGQTHGSRVFRVHRDVRFSTDKTP